MNAYLSIIAVVLCMLTPNGLYNTSDWVPDQHDPVTILHASDLHYGPAGTQNRDEAPVGSGASDPNDRLYAAMSSIAGNRHPIDATTIRPTDAIILTGDLVHEGTESTARLLAHFPTAYMLDGNHDRDDVRSMIRARHGSLTWGVKIGRVWFQALTESYVSSISNAPPGVSQINGPVAASIARRSAGEPTIFLVHRSMTGGYAAEWDRTAATTITEDLDATETGVDVASAVGISLGQRIQIDTEEMEITGINGLTLTVIRGASNSIAATHANGATAYATSALDAFEALCKSCNTLCILNGHDHATRHNTWRGLRVFSPGSITQSPMTPPPYSSIYPEAFNVLRIGNGWFDIANYNFGYDATQTNPRHWNPDVWNWAERLSFTV